MARWRYSDEYQQGEAVELTRMSGVALQQVARHPGSRMLGRWRKAIKRHGEEAFPGQGHARDEEPMRLKRELIRIVSAICT